MRAMALDPRQRFASVADLAKALEPFGGGVSSVILTHPKTGVAHRASVPPNAESSG